MDAYLATDYILLAADYAQTRSISESCHSGGVFRESNPLLGSCPSMGRVNAHFAGSAIALYALSETLEPRYRKAFLIGVGLLESAVVAHNLKIGIKF